MLAGEGQYLPHAWIASDDEMGRSTRFRRELRALGEPYLLAVPSDTDIRDLEAERPGYAGRGPRPKQPFRRVDRWGESLPENDWMRIDVRDGKKGPLVIEAVKTRVEARTERRRGRPTEEVLFVTRTVDEEGKMKHDYYLSSAGLETPLEELARVARAEHRIEESIQWGKSQAGLSDYEVRTWVGWHRHQALSLIAIWFLICETCRGEKMDTGCHGSSDSPGAGDAAARSVRMRRPGADCTRTNAAFRAKRTGEILPLEKAQVPPAATR